MGGKKIGIITLHQITNYGGILQAYALQKVLERYGYEAEIIEKVMWPRLQWWRPLIYYPYRLAKKIFLKDKSPIRREIYIRNSVYAQWYEAAYYTNIFIEKYIHRHYVYDYSEVHSNEYYAFIVGSDQIWRPKYLRNEKIPIEDAFLGFSKGWDVKRVAYAASFGTEEWEYSSQDTQTCKELLKSFDVVTCRESSGVALCRNYLGCQNALNVLDPTLLLNQNDYKSLITDYDAMSEGELFCYVLDRNKKSSEITSIVAANTGYRPFEVLAKSYEKNAIFEEKVQPPVEKWLKAFIDAKFIITDSFHACVFSIIFRKPFIAIINENRGRARYHSLLEMFNMSYRLVDKVDRSTILRILTIPFSIDDSVLEDKRKASLLLLEQSLK